MKYLLLFCAALCLSVFAKAQRPKYDHNSSVKAPDKLKVSLSNDKLTIVYKNQEIPGATLQVLDSLIKKVPGKEQLMVEFENFNGEPEKNKNIDAILKKCQCHVAKHSIRKNFQ